MADESLFNGNLSFGVNESETTRNPWAPAIPYIKRGLGEASSLMDRGPYQGRYWVDPNDMQRQAWGGGAGMLPEQLAMGDTFRQFGQGALSGIGSGRSFLQSVLQGGDGLSNPYASDQYNQVMQEQSWTPEMQASLDAALQQVDQGRQMAYKDNRLGASLNGVPGGSDALRGYAGAAEEAAGTMGQITANQRMAGLQFGRSAADNWAQNQMTADQYNLGRQGVAAQNLMDEGYGGLGLMAQGTDYRGGAYRDLAGWGDYQGGFDREQMAGEQQRWAQPWEDVNNFWNIAAHAGGLGGTTKSETKDASGSFGFG